MALHPLSAAADAHSRAIDELAEATRKGKLLQNASPRWRTSMSG
jgi:hypothetical protein